jgi:6-pyruvoyltetrahydropterin/6-carboxytetrahydropterin synthase
LNRTGAGIEVARAVPAVSTEELIMHIYTLAVTRDFVARHYLVGGDWGAENELHSHHYQVEVQLEGKTLDEHGYLVDIVAVEAHLEELMAYYRDQTLNDLPEFAGLNPSIEHFARILGQELLSRVKEPLNAVTVRIWENDIAWAAYREER